MTKILTISIAAYNVEKYLNNTLSSLVIEELLDKIEVLIVNDGSSDRTSEIAHEYENRYPNVFKVIDKSNGGYGSTINASIRVAKGTYFKILDGDDWYCTANLLDFVRFLEEAKADIVISPYILFNECTEQESLVDIHEIHDHSIDVYFANSNKMFRMHEMCIKTELLVENNVSITENCFYTDNEYVFIPLLYAKSLEKYSKPVYVYRIGNEGQSVSLNGRKKHWQDAAIVEKKLFSYYIKQKNTLGNEIRNALKIVLRDLAKYQLMNYCLIDDATKGKHELIEFDRYLKSTDKEIYNMIHRKYRKIALLRLTKYASFGIVRQAFIKECTDA